MSKHTPGPWGTTYAPRTRHNLKTWHVVAPARSEHVSPTRICTTGALVEAEANARLIAAAPDLLDVLKDALKAIDQLQDAGDAVVVKYFDNPGWQWICNVYDEGHAAIAKAEA